MIDGVGEVIVVWSELVDFVVDGCFVYCGLVLCEVFDFEVVGDEGFDCVVVEKFW